MCGQRSLLVSGRGWFVVSDWTSSSWLDRSFRCLECLFKPKSDVEEPWMFIAGDSRWGTRKWEPLIASSTFDLWFLTSDIFHPVRSLDNDIPPHGVTLGNCLPDTWVNRAIEENNYVLISETEFCYMCVYVYNNYSRFYQWDNPHKVQSHCCVVVCVCLCDSESCASGVGVSFQDLPSWTGQRIEACSQR